MCANTYFQQALKIFDDIKYFILDKGVDLNSYLSGNSKTGYVIDYKKVTLELKELTDCNPIYGDDLLKSFLCKVVALKKISDKIGYQTSVENRLGNRTLVAINYLRITSYDEKDRRGNNNRNVSYKCCDVRDIPEFTICLSENAGWYDS